MRKLLRHLDAYTLLTFNPPSVLGGRWHR